MSISLQLLININHEKEHLLPVIWNPNSAPSYFQHVRSDLCWAAAAVNNSYRLVHITSFKLRILIFERHFNKWDKSPLLLTGKGYFEAPVRGSEDCVSGINVIR